MSASDSNRGFRQRLLELIDRSGVSDLRLSLLATGSTDTVRNLRHGSSPRLDSLDALCRVLGFRLEMAPLDEPAQPAFNRAMARWASGALPGLLAAARRQDVGWSPSSLGTWFRRDETPLDTKSDGYATGLVTFALQQAGLPRDHGAIAGGVAWLARNQDPDGSWPAWSLNRNHDPASDRDRFMRDAATAYAVLALTAGDRRE